MNERKCDFKIIAFVGGKRIDIECSKETGCLSELVWGGLGVRKAAAQALVKTGKGTGMESIEAYVEDGCLAGEK